MPVELTFIEHLAELRRRLMVVLAVVLVGSFIAFPLTSEIIRWLKVPGLPYVAKLAFFSPQEALLSYLKVAIFSSIFVSSPVILFEVWAFVSPALDPAFKKNALSFVFWTTIFFVLGCVFAYWVLLPTMLQFLFNFAGEEMVPVISVDKYISFVLGLMFGVGLVFEMPVVIYLLTRAQIVTPSVLRKNYGYALLIILVTAAIVTPSPDAFSMLVLALPMLALYEIGIWVSRFAGAKKN